MRCDCSPIQANDSVAQLLEAFHIEGDINIARDPANEMPDDKSAA